MLLYRRLFLATLISVVSVTLADIIVHSAHQFKAVPNNEQHVSSLPSYTYNRPLLCYEPITKKWHSLLPDQHVGIDHSEMQYTLIVKTATGNFPCIVPKTELWRTLPNQHKVATQPQQLMGIQTVQPHTVTSNILEFPNYPWVSSPPITSTSHVTYTKIGDHEYTQPTMIVKYPKSAHYRYRRSTETTSAESDKPAIATHADDVAAESALIDKHSTFVDSLLPENQPTDTNNKHVTSRQIKSNHDASHGDIQIPEDPNTPKQLDEQSPASIIGTNMAEPTLLMIPQERQLHQQVLSNTYQESGSKDSQKDTPQIKVDESSSYPLPSTITLPENKRKAQIDKTKSFTYNLLGDILKLEIKLPAHSQSWLSKLLFTSKNKHSDISDGNPVKYSVNNQFWLPPPMYFTK